ncbi:LolA family protein [Actinoplanes rectilineatus]|uniref:LolA family protein n=1 Tax=Actinoplanes rectilineatus TaxID=113571 RepID=UPI000A8570FB|nr:sigma-E factor regulatory protein RseB domain-containing protein [Actinoplanes rectilineatus]
MSVFMSRPALRWLVPSAAAIAVIGGGAAAGTIVANADPALPDRTAAQLLVDLQSADVKGLSGTVVQNSDLGLPGIAGLLGKAGGTVSGGNPASLIAGSNTARVWYAGDEKVRLALLGTDGETDVIRNGSDVWVWNSGANKATHVTLDGSSAKAGEHARPESLPSSLPSTPQEAADAALAAIDSTTAVTTTGAAKVAGRDAYELVLSPRDTDSLVGQVRLAVDAEQHIPLRVDVYAKNTVKPAVRVAFEQISFGVPDAEQFTFNPPPGATIDEKAAGDVAEEKASGSAAEKHAENKGEPSGKPETAGDGPKVIGKGWTSILTASLPKDSVAEAEKSEEAAPLVDTLEKVSGTWGSGRLLRGSLFSALITDDGRVFAGAVTPEALYAVA